MVPLNSHTVDVRTGAANYHSPIYRLPVEILQQTLICASQNPGHRRRQLHSARTHAPYFPYTGLFICKNWSSALMNTPKAWQSVFILCDKSYQPEAALIRVQRHQLLSKAQDPIMHLDIYHQYEDPLDTECFYVGGDEEDRCSFCRIRDVMGLANLWGSLRIIMALVTEIDLAYVDHLLFKSFAKSRFSPLRFLRRLAIVPHHNVPDAIIAGNSHSLREILESIDLHDLILANLKRDLDRGLSDPDPPAINTQLRSLTLENVSIEAFELFPSLEFPNLRDLVITSAAFSSDTDDLSGMTRALSSVETAKLEFQDLPVVDAILSALLNVKHLELCSDNTTIWPQALTDSHSCRKLESIVFHHSVTFDAIRHLAWTRWKVLTSIEVRIRSKCPETRERVLFPFM